jgi:hypothetical protein
LCPGSLVVALCGCLSITVCYFRISFRDSTFIAAAADHQHHQEPPIHWHDRSLVCPSIVRSLACHPRRAVVMPRHPPAQFTSAQLVEMNRVLCARLPITVVRQLQRERDAFLSGSGSSFGAPPEARPKHPAYAQLHIRLNSFTHWPHYAPEKGYVAATPFTLAMEGFFQPADKSVPDCCVRNRDTHGGARVLALATAAHRSCLLVLSRCASRVVHLS